MNDAFRRAISAGVAHSTDVFGEPFEIDGMTYSGVFSSASVDVAMLTQGFNSTAQYVMKAPLDQFASRPAERSSLTWRGESWIIMQDMQPANEFSFVAAIVRRSAVQQ